MKIIVAELSCFLIVYTDEIVTFGQSKRSCLPRSSLYDKLS